MPTFCFACEILLDEEDKILSGSPGSPCPRCDHTTIVRYQKGQEFSVHASSLSERTGYGARQSFETRP